MSEALALAVLAMYAGHLRNEVTSAAVGFLAAWQVAAMSRIHGWSFNTGMTTGNLMSALSAATAAWRDARDVDARLQTTALGLMCLAFVLGATVGATLTRLSGDYAALVAAAAILCAAAIAKDLPDPALGGAVVR